MSIDTIPGSVTRPTEEEREIAELKAEVERLTKLLGGARVITACDQIDLTILRRLLWLRHGCVGLYGDDGEMQCGECGIDFKRMEPEDIDAAFQRLGLAKLQQAADLNVELERLQALAAAIESRSRLAISALTAERDAALTQVKSADLMSQALARECTLLRELNDDAKELLLSEREASQAWTAGLQAEADAFRAERDSALAKLAAIETAAGKLARGPK